MFSMREYENIHELKLKSIIFRLRRMIPFNIYLQGSKIIRYKGKIFFPKIFLTRIEYHNMVIIALRKIVSFLKSIRGKRMILDILQRNLKLDIMITQSGVFIFHVTN